MKVRKKRKRRRKRKNTSIKNPEERDLPVNLQREDKDHVLMTEDKILLQEEKEGHHQTLHQDAEDPPLIHLLHHILHQEREGLHQILHQGKEGPLLILHQGEKDHL